MVNYLELTPSDEMDKMVAQRLGIQPTISWIAEEREGYYINSFETKTEADEWHEYFVKRFPNYNYALNGKISKLEIYPAYSQDDHSALNLLKYFNVYSISKNHEKITFTVKTNGIQYSFTSFSLAESISKTILQIEKV